MLRNEYNDVVAVRASKKRKRSKPGLASDDDAIINKLEKVCSS